MSQFRAGQYVPPVKRPRADSNGSALVAGSSSTEDPTAVSTDAPAIEDEDLEDEEEYDEEVDEGADVDEDLKKVDIQKGVSVEADSQHNVMIYPKDAVEENHANQTLQTNCDSSMKSEEIMFNNSNVIAKESII